MSDNTITAYCLTCKERREITNLQAIYSINGVPLTKGTCTVCGKTVSRSGRTEAHDNIPKPEKTSAPARKAKAPAKKTASSKGKKAGTTKPKKTSKSSGGKASAHVGKLVIVESPAKANSIGRYLGAGYTVKASKGHVRDLLKSRLSVDIENDFEPEYRVPNEKRETIRELKADAESAEEIYLATDPDREGEAIAWHLIAAAEMNTDKPMHRVVFHEITKSAIQEAFEHPRNINMDLVNAQQARRILDRLVGYKLTPLLWDKVLNHLSAGRVQSVALRMIVEREEAIERFTPVESWTIKAQLNKKAQNGTVDLRPFTAQLQKIDAQDAQLNTEADVTPHLALLEQSTYSVKSVKRGTRKRNPSAPYTTSTLQQEASRRLGYSTNRTMQLAQKLYEGIDIGRETVGLITYMRTDSTNVSKQAQEEAKQYIVGTFGAEYVPAKPPIYKTKSQTAQEAHEAIRPTAVTRTPESVTRALLSQERDGQALLKLYTLIWQRFVASQMESAVYNTLSVDISAVPQTVKREYTFRVSGSTIKFKGFLALYEEAQDEDAVQDEDEGRIIPDLTESELLNFIKLLPEQHFTQPPPRYTEASLVNALEKFNIGRPSTYAPTVRVIQDRDYVAKENKRLIPTDIGRTVIHLLNEHFPEVMDYNFTAQMEQKLDDIADGNLDWRPMLKEFYTPFEQRIQNATEKIPPTPLKVGRTCPTCGNGDLIIKSGRFGKFIGCTNHPECRHTERYVEYTGLPCPICGTEHGGEVVGGLRSKKGRAFFGCSRYPDCTYMSWKLPNQEGDSEENDEELMQQDAS